MTEQLLSHLTQGQFATRFNSQHEGWKAQLTLGFSNRGDKTVIKQRKQRGPLAIQRPLYPEGKVCHTYILHPPGGVVGGDELTIEACCYQGAQALVTTPGATKFYRSEQKIAKQKQILHVQSGARLEWLPQENIFFPGAEARVDTDIHLADDAQFMGWELHCFGRPALNEGFDQGRVTGKTQIFQSGVRLLTEHINLRGDDKLMLNKGLLNYPMMGSLFITSHQEYELNLVQGLLSQLQSQHGEKELVLGVTHIEGLLIVRALSYWSERILSTFIEIWRAIRQEWTGISPCNPRIWAT
ncbi:urease accessory protein UreD [Vibrio sp. Of7-15]|uniref:urease accessory protein UreD n=1 Tax=Vibrio sp. Of7-15 TaxID=2724879 RepID=UPI001EF211BB|nr:urease accessory protein UreD [Vibrio sp. Of7-15]MCG7497398.1 urease accessory protein UreD [Vibrio sp. Of7-15]